MKKYKNVSLMAFTVIALIASTTFVACSNDDSIIENQQPAGAQTYTMTINATKGSDDANVKANTRALSLDEMTSPHTLNATWAVGEAVTVYNVTKSADLSGTLTAQYDGESTTLKGELTGTIENGDVLKLKFLSPDYSTQEGTLEYIAANCDYAEANVTVTDASTPSVTTTDADFVNQQAIVKFTLKKKADNSDLEIPAATAFTVSDGTTDYTVTPASATDELFVAIPGISSKTVTLVATDGEDYYYYQKTGVTFDNSQYYAIGVKMEKSDLARPLTFEAKTAGATVTFSKGSSFTGTVQCSTDGGKTWSDYSSAISLANVGDKVMFRGNNSAYYSGSASKFSCGQDCYIYGNIMSLVSSTGYPTTPSAGGGAFRELFAGNTHIKSHATKKLILSATTLTGGNSCNKMFNGCTGLTTLPELHVTTLGNYCYQNMFNGCTGLTSVPEDYLPATTLTPACYLSMFEGCTNLTSVPNLPATTLQPRCYYNMFKGCTKLTTVPSNLLPATTMANAQESKGCYEGMFQNCTKLENLPNLPATVLKDRCYTNMFYGCTSLTTIPSNYLPAATLAPYCYTNMFRGAGMTTVNTNMMSAATTMAAHSCESMFRECPNLTNTPEIFATTLDEYCCNAMFYHCTKITTSAPLHATTLVDHCYYNLFNGCSLLASVTCYATDISATDCTGIWLADAGKDVTGSKTFTTPSSTAWPTNTSGIPSGWTRVNL